MSKTNKLIDDRYLGDGVYARFTGYNTQLDLRGQDDTTLIVLEPQVLEALAHFQRDIAAAQAEAKKQ